MTNGTFSKPRILLLYVGGLLALYLGIVCYRGTSLGEEVENGPRTVIGIHFGRTHAQVGIIRNGTFEMIVDGQNRSEIPSYVAFPNQGPPLVGFAAKEQAASNLEGTIYDLRALIGRDFFDPTLRSDIEGLPYNVIENENDGRPLIKVRTNGKVMSFPPENIAAMVFSNLKTMAETHLDRTIKDVVVTLPSYFNDEQREATKNSAAMAGLEVLRIIIESTSAGIAFEVGDTVDAKGVDRCSQCYFIFYHLDEAEFVLNLEETDDGVFERLAVIRDKDFGVDALEQGYSSPTREQAAIRGSPFDLGHTSQPNSEAAQVQLQYPGDHLDYRAILLTKKLLKNAGLEKKDISWLIFTGNPEQVAREKPLIEAYFGGKKALSESLSRAAIIDEDDAIVRGAAMISEILSHEGDGRDRGCSLMWDTSELTLGIETVGDVFTKLISRGTVLPARKSLNFSTASDNQTKAILKILEGERAIASKNRQIATLELAGFPPRATGVQEIEVTFAVDHNGILRVTADENESGMRATIVLDGTDYGPYIWEDIDEIIREGEAHLEEDQLLLNQLANKVLDEEELAFGLIAKPIHSKIHSETPRPKKTSWLWPF